MHEEYVDVPFQNATLRVQLQIMSNYRAVATFTYSNRPYTFEVTKWSGQGLARFLPLALVCRPDPNLPMAADGTIPAVSQQQRVAIVIQGARDVLATIDTILTRHGRGILDYAVWHRENATTADRFYGLEGTYEAYVTLIACHAIVHMDFMAPNVQWAVVHFRK